MVALILGAAFAAVPGVFEGTWVYSGGDAERTALAEVVEGGAQRFNFAIRPIARRALNKATSLDEKIAISGDATKLTMTYTGGNSRVSAGPPDGSHFTLRDNDVVFDLNGNTLLISGEGAEGGKASTYTVSGDTMKVSHKVWSDRLGDPALTWTISYTRQ